MDIVVKKIYDIKKDPISYLGKKSIYLLRMYINGYMHHIIKLNPDFTTIYHHFYAHIRSKDIYSNAQNFNLTEILHAYSTTDEEAFDLFYKHFDDFLESQNIDTTLFI